MKCVDFPYSFFLLAIYFYAIDSFYTLKKILISPIFYYKESCCIGSSQAFLCLLFVLV